MSEYVKFELVEQKPKTGVYVVLSKSQDELLGTIKWYGCWRQYIFVPERDFELEFYFSSSCLHYIAEYLQKLNREQREKRD